MLELLSFGIVLGLKDKKIDLGELNEKALEEDESPPFIDDGDNFSEVVKTDADSDDAPPFFSGAEDGAEEAPPFSPPPESVVEAPQSEAISQLEGKLSELSDAIEKVETLVSGFDDRISKIERSMESLLSVYELVTNEINPFIGVAEGGNGEEKEEKKAVLATTANGQVLEEQVLEKRVMELKPNGDRVRLTKINNDPNSLLLLFKWLDFLIRKVGYQGMIKTLLFYEEVGWLTREVRDQIIKYSRDLGGTRASRGNRKLTTLEHIISLFFIIKLQGLEVSPTLYSEVVNQLDESGIV